MDVLTFSIERISRKDLILGITGSILLHISFMLTASVLPGMSKTKEGDSFSFYTVDIVTAEETQASVLPENKAAEAGTSTDSAPVTEDSASAIFVKKLQLDSPPTETALEKLALSHTPKILRRPSPSIDRSLDKLIPKRNPPRPAPPTPSPSTRTASPQGGQGSSAAGQGGQLDRIFRLYLPEVWNAIRQQWVLPQTLKNAHDLEATLIVRVRRDGKILSHRFEKKSGNDLYDESVVRAINKSDPLPPFPQAYPRPQEEIGVRFRPEDLN